MKLMIMILNILKYVKEKIKKNCIRTGINFVTYNLHNSNLDF